MENFSDDYVLVYTLPQLYEALSSDEKAEDKDTSAVKDGIYDYMESNPEGFGTMEREEKDFGYDVSLINVNDRVYVVRDVYQPKDLDSMIQARRQQQVNKETVRDSVNAAVYSNKNSEKAKEQAQITKEQKQNRFVKWIRDVFVNKDMEMRNKWQDFLRHNGVNTKVSIPAARLVSSDIKLRQAKIAVQGTKIRDDLAGLDKSKAADVEKRYHAYLAEKLAGTSKIKIAAKGVKLTKEEKEFFEERYAAEQKARAKAMNKGKPPVKQTTVSDELFKGLFRKREQEKQEERRRYTPPADS